MAETTQHECDFVPLARAARIVAPIADQHHHSYFEGGVFLILSMLAECQIATRALKAPPTLPRLDHIASAPLTQPWFAEVARGPWDPYIDRSRRLREPAHKFLSWAKANLLVSRVDVMQNLNPPFSPGQEPESHHSAAGAWWSFPQIVAWVATRDSVEVARIGSALHFGPLISSASVPVGMTVGPSDRGLGVGAPTNGDQFPGHTILQSDDGRRKLVGWLAMVTALKHCQCSAQPSAEKEQWESCSCLGNAYDKVRRFGPVAAQPIPRYQPQPEYGSFSLEWSDEVTRSGAHRADVLEWWPEPSSIVAKVAVNGVKQRPGPKPDPDWPAAIAAVTTQCRKADYKRPLKRGQKAGIQTMLLTFMAEQRNKHFSDDAAANYAKEVIAALPQSEQLSAS